MRLTDRMCPSFPFGFEGGTWELIVLISNHCLSVYFGISTVRLSKCPIEVH